MITYFVVTSTTTPGVPVTSPPCPSIEKALSGAESLSGDGAVTAKASHLEFVGRLGRILRY
jgi:hypothetical protein